MTELSVLTKVPSQYVEERRFKSGRHESERRESSVLLEFCTFKKIENDMLGVRAGVWAQEPVKSGKGLGQPQGCPRRQDHPTGEAEPGSGCAPCPLTGLCGILFYSLRARMEKQALEPSQDPGLTHMSWRKF